MGIFSMTQSRRRPKRQRTPTTIYTDDNPTTFTTKKKKGQSNGHDDDDRRSSTGSTGYESENDESSSMPPPAPVVKRGPGRPPSRRKSVEKVLGKTRGATNGTNHAATPESTVGSASSGSASNANGVQPTPKRKRGRPPKNRPKEPKPEVESNGSSSKMETDAKASEETTTELPVHDPSTTESPDTDVAVNESEDRRKSLPDSSEPMTNDTGRSRRSLDSLLSSKKDHNSSKSAGKRISNLKRKSKHRSNSSTSWTPPYQDTEGTFVNHSVTVAPILPPVLIRDNDDDHKPLHDGSELQSKYPVVFDKGVPKASSCIAPPFSSSSQNVTASSRGDKLNPSQHQLAQLPTWTPLYDPPVFFDMDYDEETGNLDIENTIPVKRHITAMTVRKPDHDYLVLGDSVGFVTIYSLSKDNITLPIAQLESMACQQRGRAEQERLRADLLKRKKQARGKNKSLKTNSRPGTPNQLHNPFAASAPQNVRTIAIDTSDTTIHALDMIKNRVVLATERELECMDVPSGTSLWVCPLSANRFVTSLDMHLNTFDVLVSCSKTSEEALPVSPLMLLQHSEEKVEICDANSPMLVRSPSCTAIWDMGAANRLLFICVSAKRDEHELVLVSGGSIDSWKLVFKTKIPIKTSSSVAAATKLSQSPGGIYTLVASSRGIRLYQTESLQLIHVYGDQFTLHGQSVMWKDCWLAGSFFSEKNKTVTKAAKGLSSQWLQCDDWVNEKIGESTKTDRENPKDKKTPNLAPYIIGVPHAKGPKELCENLHVWKVEHPSVVPMMSVPLPYKAEGALGLVGSGNQSRKNNSAFTEDRIVLVTDDGKGHLLRPKMESNFAGIVYPPGYQVVTDNIEYIEDEEATDQVVEDSPENNSDDEAGDVDILGDDDESMDEDMREAMRQSLLEHNGNSLTEYNEDVDILGTNDEKEMDFLPCRPEPYLRQMVNAVSENEETPENETKDEKGAKSDGDEKSNSNDEMDTSTNDPVKPKLTDAMFISNVLQIMPNVPKIKPLEEDCLSFTTTKVVVAVNPVVKGRGRKSRAANLETMLKASINPYLQSMMLSRQGVPVNGKGSTLKPFSSCDKKKSKTPAYSETPERVNGEAYSTDSSVAGLHVKVPSSSPRHATKDEEAVVLGLLGLSPCQTPNVQSNSFVSSDSKEAQKVLSAANGKGSAYLNSTSLSMLGVKNDDNQVVSALSSDRGSAAEGSEFTGENDKSKLDVIDRSCSACRGRLVIHSCGKRSLPIDYEEIARAERERKEKEEEEKKRLKAEKRRLADQKRKEAKKQKQRELEEQRLREENERREAEERRRLQEELAAQEINKRRQQIVASYANYQVQSTVQAPNELHSVDYSQSQPVQHQYLPNGQAAVTHNPNPNGSIVTQHVDYSVQARPPLAQAAMPSVSATLASADALVALANLADHTETLPESRSQGTLSNDPPYATNPAYSKPPEPTTNQYGVPAFGASHGFSVRSNQTSDFGGEAKRGIPSYDSIRNQYNSGSPSEVPSAMSNSLSATTSYYNGHTTTWPTQDRG